MIPSPDYFKHLYEYVKWADLRQLDAVKPLSDEQYFRDHGWSFGTVHKLLLHGISAQSVWLNRFQGNKPVWLFDDPMYSGRAAIETAMRATHDKGTAFLAAQTPASLAGVLHYTNLKGEPFDVPLWHLLVHLCNHSTHHRGQINSMIKLSGGEPAAVDYSLWVTSFGGMVT